MTARTPETVSFVSFVSFVSSVSTRELMGDTHAMTAHTHTVAHTGTPYARFAVSGIGGAYTVWDNARGTFAEPFTPCKKLESAYAMAEFLNRHVPPIMFAIPALPAPFTPCATDTGTTHGPHPYVVFAGHTKHCRMHTERFVRICRTAFGTRRQIRTICRVPASGITPET